MNDQTETISTLVVNGRRAEVIAATNDEMALVKYDDGTTEWVNPKYCDA